ncbi:MAG: P44/Msp2 family outer membrane protein [Alphaproteobacteria bacterium]|nr:P44/Msp2 family outer membrane protein [Alphaproteobacteria bacterium]
MPGRTFRYLAGSAVAAALLTAAPAVAQSFDSATAADDWALYARLGVGWASPNRLDQDLAFDPRTASFFTPPNRRVIDLEDAASPTFAIGVAYPAGTRTELEYRFLQPSFDEVTLFGGFGPGVTSPFPVTPSDEFTAHFLMSNAYFEVVRFGPVGAFVGAGVGGGFFADGLGQRDAAFAYQGRTGVTVDLSRRATLQIEYVYLRTRDIVFGPDRLGRGALGGFQALGEPFVMSAADASIQFRF